MNSEKSSDEVYQVKGLYWLFAALLVMTLAPAVVLAASDGCLGDECGFKLDREAFKKTVAQRLTVGLKQQGNDVQYPTDNIEIVKTVPFSVGDDYSFVAVRVILNPVDEAHRPAENVLVVDPGGRIMFGDIQDLVSGEDLAFKASSLVKKEKLPPGFGAEAVSGNGDAEVVMVSDPICPYCKKAFAYFMNHLDRIETVKLVHLPLPSHPGAEAASAAIIYARDNDIQPEEVARFAYLDLDNPQPEGETQEERVENARQNVLDQLTEAFPKLAESLGDDPLATLMAATEDDREAHQKMASEKGLTFTPVIYVDGVRIDGFKESAVAQALQVK
jgi:protein-disulfide isomerase